MKPLKQAVVGGLDAIGLEQFARSIKKRADNFGLRYKCPMCGSHLKEFLAGGEPHAVLIEKSVVGGGERDNVLCPVCGSSDRERLLFMFLKNRPSLLPSGAKLLHVAPEYGLRSWLQSLPSIEYITADLMMEDVSVKIDLTDIQLPDARFDGIICSHVLEHIPNDALAMREMRRVLKPGGWAILQVPISLSFGATYEDFSITDPQDRERAFGQNDHVRIYAMDYVDRLKSAEFAVQPFSWPTAIHEYGGRGNKYGLIEKELVFFATRSAI